MLGLQLLTKLEDGLQNLLVSTFVAISSFII